MVYWGYIGVMENEMETTIKELKVQAQAILRTKDSESYSYHHSCYSFRGRLFLVLRRE